MSRWLAMARAADEVHSLGTKDKTDKKDKTSVAEVLSQFGGVYPKQKISRKLGKDRTCAGSVPSVPQSDGQVSEIEAGGVSVRSPAVVSEPAPCPQTVALPNELPGPVFPRTCSGGSMSLSDYRVLTDRERDAPTGPWFCGKCQRYRDPQTALRCLDGVEACL